MRLGNGLSYRGGCVMMLAVPLAAVAAAYVAIR